MYRHENQSRGNCCRPGYDGWCRDPNHSAAVRKARFIRCQAWCTIREAGSPPSLAGTIGPRAAFDTSHSRKRCERKRGTRAPLGLSCNDGSVSYLTIACSEAPYNACSEFQQIFRASPKGKGSGLWNGMLLELDCRCSLSRSSFSYSMRLIRSITCMRSSGRVKPAGC